MSRTRPTARRRHLTQKVRIGGTRTLYVSVDGERPLEVFLRVHGKRIDPEVVVLYDVIARVMSLALQHDAPLALVAETLFSVRSSPGGSVAGDERIKWCDGPLDFIGRHLLVHFCQRDDLAHMTQKKE